MEAALPAVAYLAGGVNWVAGAAQTIHDPERRDLPSASASARRILCAGSHKASIGKREVLTPEMQAWRDEGNRIHDWLHTHLGFRLGLGGSTATLEQSLVTLTEHEHDVADRCVEQARELLSRVFPFEWTSGSVRLIQEQRMWLYFPDDTRERFSGKADAIFIWKDPGTVLWRCLIIDFKTNRGDIEESPRNPQLRDLAVLLWLTLGGKVSSITVAIVQPLVSKLKDPTEYDVPALHVAHNMLVDSLAESELPDPPLRPGHEQCKFCPAKISCRAVKELRDTLNPDVLGATPAELAEWLDKAEPIVMAYNSARNAARAHLEMDPASMPAWQLVPSSPNREIQNPKLAYDNLVAAGHIDLDTFLSDAVTLSLGSLKDALVKFGSLKPQRLADDIINTACAPAITLKQKNPSLVRK